MTLETICIGDLGRVVTGDTPPKSNATYYGSAYPFIKPTDMKVGERYTRAIEDGYSEEAFEKYRKKLIPAGSTAVVTIGSIGQKLTMIETPSFVNQAVNAVIPNRDKFDPLYVYYLLRHNLHLIKSADTGASSGRENVSKSNFASLPIAVTKDRATQERIGSILGGYDDLIENNQRRISLLEESVRMLYREWFMSLRFAGKVAQRNATDLPEGWSRETVRSLASFVSRGITPQYDEAASGLVINQKCIRGGRLTLTAARRQSKEVKTDRQLQVGDVLINSTGAGTLGRVAQVRTAIPDCTVDTHVTIVRPNDPNSAAFLGVALLEQEAVLATMGVGSTNQLELSRSDIASISLVVPTEQLRAEFQELVWPIFMQAETLAKSNEGLVDARDALLPKIISGQFTV